jgi:hypothetical protein
VKIASSNVTLLAVIWTFVLRIHKLIQRLSPSGGVETSAVRVGGLFHDGAVDLEVSVSASTSSAHKRGAR